MYLANSGIIIGLTSLIFFGCAVDLSQCEEAIINTKERVGSVRIDTIYNKWGDRAITAQDIYGTKLLYQEVNFVIQPELGDSLHKELNSEVYLLIKSDSTYIQKWDCKQQKAVIVERWGNVPN